MVQCDVEFKKLRTDDNYGIKVKMNFSSKCETVGEAKRNDNTIENHFRRTSHCIPCKNENYFIIRHLAMMVGQLLNMLPVKGDLEK